MDYPSAAVAGRDLGLTGKSAMTNVLRGEQDLPDEVTWAEYVDKETEAKYREKRLARRDRPAEERGDAAKSDGVIAVSPEGISLRFPSIAAAARDERVPDSLRTVHRYLTGKTRNPFSGWTYSYVRGSARPRNNGRVAQAVDIETGEVIFRGSPAEIAGHVNKGPRTISRWIKGEAPQPSEQAAQGKTPRPQTAHLVGIRFEWVN